MKSSYDKPCAKTIAQSILTARLFFTFHINGCKRLQALSRIFRPLGRNRIVCPFALFSSDNNAGITEDFHMVGQCRLGDIEFLQQAAAAFFSGAQELENAYAVFITKRLKNNGGFLFIQIHSLHLP